MRSVNKFAIIVLHYCGLDDTLECLDSLEKLDYQSFELILVDNGSTDLKTLKERHPHLIFVENEENLGFAEGNNRGIAQAMERGADWIVMLNNDTIVAPNFLQQLAIAAKEHPKAGVLGAKIFFHDDPATLWYAGGGVDQRLWRCYHTGCGDHDIGDKYRQIVPIEYACGCALAISKEALCEVGGMSPEYFLIWEEIDWCYRLRGADFECLFVPGAHVWHKVSQSFAGGNRSPMWHYFYMRGRLLFIKRHAHLRQRLLFYVRIFIPELLQLLTQSAKKCSRSRAALLGIYDFFRGNLGPGRLSSFIKKTDV